jgi:AcrR family transcriptional regulator
MTSLALFYHICYITSVVPRIVDHEERRSHLADAAATLIADAGLDAAGLRQVARAGAVTTGAVTHYFDSKEALLDAAYTAVMERLAAQQQAGPPIEVQDAGVLAGYLSCFLPNDADSRRDWRVWLAFSARALVDPHLAAQHRAAYARITAQLAAEVADLPDAAAIADMLVALIDGLAIRMMLEPGDWPVTRVLAVLMTVTPVCFPPEEC